MSLLCHFTLRLIGYNNNIKKYYRFLGKIKDVSFYGLGELYIFLGVD